MVLIGLTVLAIGEEKRTSPFTEEERAHWAYQPVQRPAIPVPGARDGIRNPVDAFVLARLEASGLKMAPQADRRALIRRLTIDLTGLPPTPAEVEAFVRDPRPDAYDHLVDRLLGSPRFGERWARHWLDLARYAESDGFKSDGVRRDAWRYRDYVVRAFNSDRPYDRFVMEQLAGDEIAPHDSEALVATGFLRHWPYEDNGRDLDRAWSAILNDVTDVTGQVFLGLTVGCARCHDHKFDAILQKDYYRWQAFFAAMVPRDDLPVASSRELETFYDKLERWESATRELRAEQERIQQPYHRQVQREKGQKFPPFVKRIIEMPEGERSIYQKQLIHLAGKQLLVEPKQMAGKMKPEIRKRWDELNERLAEFDDLRPGKKPAARGVRDIGPEAPPVRIPAREEEGDIAPGFLSVFDPRPASICAVTRPETTGRRATLARWITEPTNPLTPRVMVNRLWQHHFGRGLVATPEDFGAQGARPTHPALLDWLAAELIESGWSLKAIHRLLVTSATYRQSSVPEDRSAAAVDPDNHLLWRMNPRRVEAEILRDSVLTTSGELDLKMGGEGVYPKLPEGISARYAWKPTKEVSERFRRSVYLVVKRNMHLPILKTFDVPDNHHSCSRRIKTTTPTQALILLNDDWLLDRARVFAARLLRLAGTDRCRLIDQAYRLALGRPPDETEIAMGEEFLEEESAMIAARLARKEPVALPAGVTVEEDPALAAALVDYCHSLWNTNEFMYVD